MTKTNIKHNVADLNRLLESMNHEGDFMLSVLTDVQGLPIAFSADKHMDADKQAAVVAMLQKSTLQSSRQLGMSSTEEIMINDTEGHCLVCRSFEAGEYNMLLGVMLKNRTQPYRRLTKQLITKISQALQI